MASMVRSDWDCRASRELFGSTLRTDSRLHCGLIASTLRTDSVYGALGQGVPGGDREESSAGPQPGGGTGGGAGAGAGAPLSDAGRRSTLDPSPRTSFGARTVAKAAALVRLKTGSAQAARGNQPRASSPAFV
eukprot:1194423-Prorocentrum_minimum.AAC.11